MLTGKTPDEREKPFGRLGDVFSNIQLDLQESPSIAIRRIRLSH
jgi:hypothetical protein